VEFVKSNCGLPIGSTGRFALLVSCRENWLLPQCASLVCMSHSIAESGTLTTPPPHGTAQVAQSALRWQSRYACSTLNLRMSQPACVRSFGLQAAMRQARSTRSVAALRPLALAPHAFRRRVQLLWRRRWQSRPLSPNNSSKPTQLRGGNVLRLVRSCSPPLRRSA